MTGDQTILNEIKLAVSAVDAGAEVILFGSRARGDYKEESDWDVLVLTDRPVERDLKKKIWNRILQVELEHLIGISTIVRNKRDWDDKLSATSFYKEVSKDGILL